MCVCVCVCVCVSGRNIACSSAAENRHVTQLTVWKLSLFLMSTLVRALLQWRSFGADTPARRLLNLLHTRDVTCCVPGQLQP